MRLSSREKAMLIVLAALLALFGIYKFVYVKANAEYGSNQQRFEQLTYQQEEQNAQISRYGNINNDLSALEERAAAAAEPFFPSLEAEKLSFWLDNPIRQAGLELTGLSISDPQTGSIDQISNDVPELSVPVRRYFEAFALSPDGTEASDDAQAAQAPPAEQDQETPDDSVLSVSVTLYLTGPVSGLNDFCEQILNSEKTVAVRAMSYTFETDEDRQNDHATIAATLVFYAVPQAADDVFD